MRLNKYIASAGVSSRRGADDIIKAGRVSVNDTIITEMGYDVNPEKDIVMVDKKPVFQSDKKYYIVLNKPKGYITTTKDQFNRPSVLDLVTDISERIYPVGRLDYSTMGLLILTNDGDFTNAVTHPKNNIYKTYIVRVGGFPSASDLMTLRRGVPLEDGITAPAKAEIIKVYPSSVDIKISIHEGRNRQIRRMIEAIGFNVLELKRVAIGKVLLGNLPLGKWRHMTQHEITSLKRG